MPLCPRSRKDPVADCKDASGVWHIMCPICLLKAKRKSDDYDWALFYFWKEHDLSNEKEKPMASDYRRGVEDALTPMRIDDSIYNDPASGSLSYFDFVNRILEARRKKLLTKKVTKWTGIITSEWSGSPTILELCDTEEEVKGFLAKNPKPLTKAIPIEIETEI